MYVTGEMENSCDWFSPFLLTHPNNTHTRALLCSSLSSGEGLEDTSEYKSAMKNIPKDALKRAFAKGMGPYCSIPPGDLKGRGTDRGLCIETRGKDDRDKYPHGAWRCTVCGDGWQVSANPDYKRVKEHLGTTSHMKAVSRLPGNTKTKIAFKDFNAKGRADINVRGFAQGLVQGTMMQAAQHGMSDKTAVQLSVAQQRLACAILSEDIPPSEMRGVRQTAPTIARTMDRLCKVASQPSVLKQKAAKSQNALQRAMPITRHRTKVPEIQQGLREEMERDIARHIANADTVVLTMDESPHPDKKSEIMAVHLTLVTDDLLFLQMTIGLVDCAKDATGEGLVKTMVEVLEKFSLRISKDKDKDILIRKLKGIGTDGASTLRGKKPWEASAEYALTFSEVSRKVAHICRRQCQREAGVRTMLQQA
jgi:hypothetical protein